MTVDIVERLRRVAVAQATVTVHGCESQMILNPPVGERNTKAELDFAMRLPSLAADEIERLRRDLNMARSTLKLLSPSVQEAERLKHQIREAAELIEKLFNERDEARRELLSEHINPVAEAKRRGWDCFEEAGK